MHLNLHAQAYSFIVSFLIALSGAQKQRRILIYRYIRDAICRCQVPPEITDDQLAIEKLKEMGEV